MKLMKILSLAALFTLGIVAYPLAGTVSLVDDTTIFPGDATGSVPGIILASAVDNWSFTTTAGTTSGKLVTAVFLESSKTLDFYYQVTNNAKSATNIARVSAVDFSPFQTSVAFLMDGESLPGGLFVNGTCGSLLGSCPVTADRTGGVIGFSYGPTDAAKIAPGETDFAFVISTNATNFKPGNASILDGGSVTVNTFQPGGNVPEPETFALIGTGLIALTFARRKIR